MDHHSYTSKASSAGLHKTWNNQCTQQHSQTVLILSSRTSQKERYTFIYFCTARKGSRQLYLSKQTIGFLPNFPGFISSRNVLGFVFFFCTPQIDAIAISYDRQSRKVRWTWGNVDSWRKRQRLKNGRCNSPPSEIF